MIVKDAECVAVFGRRGSGKSTLVKRQFVKGARRLIVFDPMGEYAREVRGVRGFTSLRALGCHVASRWSMGFKVAYTPGSDEIGALHRLSAFLWEACEGYEGGRDRTKTTLIVEEANLGFPSTMLPPGRDGFRRLILQGRHRGVEIVGVTQRPAKVHPDFRSNCSRLYVFALADHVDVQAMTQIVGPAEARAIRVQENHHYTVIEGGRIERGQNNVTK